MRAADGTIVEVFEWRSAEAIQQAHNNPAVRRSGTSSPRPAIIGTG